jgi:hypothetical protein
MEEETILTCPNKSCEKTFTKPLATVNLQQDSKEPYNACPYCLTEITIPEPQSDDLSEEKEIDISSTSESPNSNKEQEITCQYYFGYLKEKERKRQIPDECITCAKIIDCMLS